MRVGGLAGGPSEHYCLLALSLKVLLECFKCFFISCCLKKNNLGQGNATSESGTVRLRYKYRQNTGLNIKQGTSSEPRARGVEFTDPAHFTGEDLRAFISVVTKSGFLSRL